MQVKLKYNDRIAENISATMIRGKNPELWLQEINFWNIPLAQLECYVIPESSESNSPYGLFVIFKLTDYLSKLKLLEPYTLISNKLFIPVNTELTPVINEAELNKFLAFEIQIFHPNIGLIGFNKSNKLDLEDLISFNQENYNNWGLAHSGLVPRPKLTKIDIVQPTADEVFELIKKAIENKPLKDIPQNKSVQAKPDGTMLQNAKIAMLKSGLFMVAVFFSMMDSLNSEQNNKPDKPQKTDKAIPPARSKPLTPNLFELLEKWLKENLSEIEKSRDNEIKRLLSLFDNDTEEALKYAIPLNSPYQNRGKALPSAKLGKRPLNFDLNSLGGGGKVDSWNIDEYYYQLRGQYLKAAEKEIQAKNIKKAAYIYANLLGDFSSAASVLEQGKFYREAAVLYKDHLKNIYAAAGCLERGGLILESIEIYKTLETYEKVGDLYKRINQKEQADIYYEKVVSSSIANNNYLAASVILSEKMEQPDRAKQILLDGWQNSNQSEMCLKTYFDIMPEEQLVQSVQKIYEHDTKETKYNNFLNVLYYLNKKNNELKLLHTSREIAYQIISKQTETGNLANLPNLKTFLPDDRLIVSDCSRFINKNQNISNIKAKKNPEYYLDGSVKWFKPINHYNQFLVFGKKGNNLHLARGSWSGNFEYYIWNDIQSGYPFNFIANPIYSNLLIIQTYNSTPLNTKKLLKDKYFDTELAIQSPEYLANFIKKRSINVNPLNNSNIIPFVNKEDIFENEIIGITINNDSDIAILRSVNQAITLQIYSPEGVMQKTVDCKTDISDLVSLLEEPITLSAEMIYNNGNYYTFKDNFFITITEDYIVKIERLHEKIELISAFQDYNEFKLIIKTESDFFIGLISENDCLLLQNFYSQTTECVDLQFISSRVIIIAEKQSIYKFELFRTKPELLYTSESPIIGVLPTNNRNQCGVIDERGKVTICDIRNTKI